MTDLKDKKYYTYEQIKNRMEALNAGDLTLSCQYGMLFLLNKDNQIILNLTDLISPEERKTLG